MARRPRTPKGTPMDGTEAPVNENPEAPVAETPEETQPETVSGPTEAVVDGMVIVTF